MAPIFAAIAPMFGAAAAGGTAAAAGTAATAAAGTAAAAGASILPAGISLGTILQGTASVLGLVTAIGAGRAESERLNLEATDTDRQQPLETLQGIKRRSSIKQELAASVGAINTAYGASGVDLSTGTAAAARRQAFRDADVALTTDAGTQEVRQSRLVERAQNYRRSAKVARRMGVIGGLTEFTGQAGNILARGY